MTAPIKDDENEPAVPYLPPDHSLQKVDFISAPMSGLYGFDTMMDVVSLGNGGFMKSKHTVS